MRVAEYIWIDGSEPVARMRSKTKIIPDDNIPDWNFDGSSTNQAEGVNSDVLLYPIYCCKNPFTQNEDILVLCECLDHERHPLESNKRSKLQNVMLALGETNVPWVGFEQEYVIYSRQSGRPLGFPNVPNTLPLPQGDYYCGVDGDVAFGRSMKDEHLRACLNAGLMIYGTNGEVMPGQWEFQMGLRFPEDNPNPVEMSDQLWLARYILYRITEKYGCYVSLDCKPIQGDWNGSGMHTNISTVQMRNSETGFGAIMEAISNLRDSHSLHIDNYGHGVKERLTGEHETAHWDKFSYGVADRTKSIRIPKAVDLNGHGYIEDRRPGANADPYVVSTLLVETICVQ